VVHSEPPSRRPQKGQALPERYSCRRGTHRMHAAIYWQSGWKASRRRGSVKFRIVANSQTTRMLRTSSFKVKAVFFGWDARSHVQIGMGLGSKKDVRSPGKAV